MGANAQTTVPTFTTGQVLTADQQNQSARTGVPVFASTVTRDAGFGGTGEKTLAEGQLCYVEGTGLQSYNGTSWVTWGTAPSSGMAVVKAQTSFSASSSVTADSVFTSTYETYLMVVRYTTSSIGSMALRLRASGTSAATNYNQQSLYANGTSVTAARLASQTSIEVGADTTGSFTSLSLITLNGPNLAEPTLINVQNARSAGAYTVPTTFFWTGNHSTATAYDGVELLPVSGTLTGNYTIYGMGKS